MKTVLFVCTGNTCRSPMAECLFKHVCRRQGFDGLSAVSAGVSATKGAAASAEARRAMERRGLSLEAHRSQPLSERLLRDVSLVVGMSHSHISTVKALFPGVDVPMLALDPPISDPYGLGYDAYERTAGELERQLVPLAASLQAGNG